MSNHHLRNHTLSLKAKGLLSQILSLPEDWDYTLQGLARINKESVDAIREAVRELERAGYIKRSRERDEHGCLRGTVYTIYEQPQQETENPTQTDPILEKPALENPTINCHERCIDYEATLCQRCMDVLSKGIRKFTGVTNRIYEMEEFDQGNKDIATHAGGFIKSAVRC